MRRFIIGLSLLAAAVFASSESFAAARASQVTGDGDWTTAGNWGATCGGGAIGAAPNTNDTVTICTGTDVYLNDAASAASIGAITIQTGASLSIYSSDATTALGSLSLANDTAITVQSGGTLNVNGSIILCSTNAEGALDGACTVGKTVPLDTAVDWSMTSASVYNVCLESSCANGSTTSYGNVLDIDVVGFADLDGSPTNDSPLSTRMPFMHVDSSWSAATDLLAITEDVGAGTPVAPTVGKTAAGCYTPRIGGDADCWGEATGGGTAEACAPIDYQSILCTAGTLDYQNDLVGQVAHITGGAAGLDGAEYQIIASREDDVNVDIDGGGASPATNFDRLIVWPPLDPVDYGLGTFPATPRTTPIFWPVGSGSSNVRGGGAREFFVFRPAQITGPTGGQRIVVEAGGTFDANYALLGPLEAVATFGPKIENSGTITGGYVWQAGISGTNGAGNTDEAGIAALAGSTTTLTHWLVSHDFEPYNAPVAADTTTIASQGISLAGSGAGGFSGSLHLALLGGKGVSFEASATGTPHFTELTLLDGMAELAGYAVDSPNNAIAASLIVDNYFAANWPGKSSTHTAGSNTGAFSFYNCVETTAPCTQRVILKNAIVWPNPNIAGGLGPVAIFGSPDNADNFRISNAWVHDYRDISSSATSLLNVWEVDHLTCLFCKTGSSVGRSVKNSAFITKKNGASGFDAAIKLMRSPATYARDYEVINNVFYDANTSTGSAIIFDDGTTASPTNGVSTTSSLTIRNNAFIHTAGDVFEHAAMIGTGFDSAASDLVFEHNLVSGFAGAVSCNGNDLSADPNPPKYNVFDYVSPATAIKQYYQNSCHASGSQSTWGLYNRTSYNNLALALASGRIAVGGLINTVGPTSAAGAYPVPFFTRSGMDLTVQFGGGGGGGGGGGAPCIGPSCQSSIGGQ